MLGVIMWLDTGITVRTEAQFSGVTTRAAFA